MEAELAGLPVVTIRDGPLRFDLPGAGLVPLPTGLFSVCPADSIFGMNTCGLRE